MANQSNNKPRNAADPTQVKKDSDKAKSLREQELSDIAAILNTPEGERFFWRFLGHCRTFESIWTPNAQIHYNAGTQDVGHFLMKEIVEAKPEALVKMMKQNGNIN
jgi:hypothetical protein